MVQGERDAVAAILDEEADAQLDLDVPPAYLGAMVFEADEGPLHEAHAAGDPSDEAQADEAPLEATQVAADALEEEHASDSSLPILRLEQLEVASDRPPSKRFRKRKVRSRRKKHRPSEPRPALPIDENNPYPEQGPADSEPQSSPLDSAKEFGL